MFKDSYRKEMDNISASEKFKKDTISLMNQKQAELQQNNTNNNEYNSSHIRRCIFGRFLR